VTKEQSQKALELLFRIAKFNPSACEDITKEIWILLEDICLNIIAEEMKKEKEVEWKPDAYDRAQMKKRKK